MTTKADLLRKIKETIIENDYAKFQYLDEQGKCCAVGYLARELGVSDQELLSLGDEFIDTLLKKDDYKSLKELFADAGFTPQELAALQLANDEYSKNDLLEYLDEQLYELEVGVEQ